jgi:hypothetical protein
MDERKQNKGDSYDDEDDEWHSEGV